MVLAFFGSAGVNITNYGGTVFFNDRNGLLFVRASMADLEIIEEAIEVLNVVPPQVSIEAKFAEVSQQDNRALGFDTFLGNVLMGGGAVGVQGGTAPSYTPPGTRANPAVPGFPTAVYPYQNFAQGAADGLISNGVEGGGNTIATITGILTNPQFRLVIKALESRSGTDVLTAPRLITISGRQAQLQVTDNRTIVTGIQSQQGQQGGQQQQQQQAAQQQQAGQGGAVSLQPTTQSLATGPVLDILPFVAADGFTISMALIPSVVEFVGYDDPGPFAVLVQGLTGGTAAVPLTAKLPLPRTRVRQVVTSVIVWDGQTVMLGGLISDEVTNTRNKVPFLGDLPAVGKLFRTESKTTFKKNLYIFVTATIIDPAGNRIHSDSELPFAAQTGPPPQIGGQ